MVAESSTTRTFFIAADGITTIAEAGYPSAEYLFWGGLFVPAKTPNDIVKRLYDEGRKALDQPTVQSALAKLGYEPMNMTSSEFQNFFDKDLNETVRLAKQVGITPTD